MYIIQISGNYSVGWLDDLPEFWTDFQREVILVSAHPFPASLFMLVGQVRQFNSCWWCLHITAFYKQDEGGICFLFWICCRKTLLFFLFQLLIEFLSTFKWSMLLSVIIRIIFVKMNSRFKSSLFWCSDMLDQSAFQVFLTESNLPKSDNFSITMIPSVLSSRCSHETNNFLYPLIHSTHVKSAVNWNVHRVSISIFDSMIRKKGYWKMHLRD